MAIVSKIANPTTLKDMLDVAYNAGGSTQVFQVYTDVNQPQIKRGESSDGDLFDLASTISGGASVVLSSNVVINVMANSTGSGAVTEIRCLSLGTYANVLFWITLAPAEEFMYAGTITITSATVTISNVMA